MVFSQCSATETREDAELQIPDAVIKWKLHANYLPAPQFDNESNNLQITFAQYLLSFTSAEMLPLLKQRGFLTLVLR